MIYISEEFIGQSVLDTDNKSIRLLPKKSSTAETQSFSWLPMSKLSCIKGKDLFLCIVSRLFMLENGLTQEPGLNHCSVLCPTTITKSCILFCLNSPPTCFSSLCCLQRLQKIKRCKSFSMLDYCLLYYLVSTLCPRTKCDIEEQL